MKKNKTCYLIGAGDFFGFKSKPDINNLIIAVDGGAKYLDIKPDILIGDFDSIDREYIKAKKIIKLKRDKNMTDMMHGARIAFALGYYNLKIYGATGGRLDHTIANMQMLSYLINKKPNAKIKIYFKNHNADKYLIMTVIKNNKIKFSEKHDGYISVFSHSDKSFGINIQGLKYKLVNAMLDNKFSLGISNEFINQKAFISVKNGVLIIIYHALD